MEKQRIFILGILGALFFFFGLYYGNISYEYLAVATWLSGLIFFLIVPRYREITFLILGLIILHTGVILLLLDQFSHPKLLGFMVFTAGIVVVLNCGFSDYIKKRKAEK